MTIPRTLLALTAAALITAGCGGSNGSDTAAGSASSNQPTSVNPTEMSNVQAPPAQVVVDATIKDGKVSPTNEQLKASLKEQIVIRVNSDAADELQVHSTPEHTFSIEAKPMQSFQFSVDVPGKVDVELHKLNQTIATIQVQ